MGFNCKREFLEPSTKLEKTDA